MKQFLKSHLKVVVFAIVFSVFAVSGAILGCLSTLVPKTSSITSTDTTSFVKIGEIFNSTDKVFYGDTLSQFYHCITGTSGATVDTVKSKINSATNKVIPASTIRGYTASGTGYSKSNTQSVVVRLGGLDWIVTYLSLNTDGDVIATLWLDDNVQDKWLADTTTYSQTAGEYYGFIDGGLYSDFSVSNDSTGNYGTELYPHNLYSTSYVRAATLNNGSGYAIEDNSATLTTATQNATNPFAMYTMEQFGLTKFLEKPKNISWQVNAQTPSLSLGNYQGTQLNNDALSVGGNYTDGTNVHNYCNEVITPEKYAEWGNDYIWLPSISETGYSDTYSGIWNLNSTERASATGVNEEIYGGIGTIGLVGHTDCFTRSAANYPVTSGVYAPSFYNFIVSATGSSYSSYSREANAIRPALHLNLSDVYTGFNIQTNINIFSAGTITGGGVYSPNDDVTLTATPNIGYIFQYWENSAGTIVSYSSTYTFTAIATDTYTAVFKEISVSFTTPNSGAEILEQLTNTNEIIIANNFVFVSGKYISSIQLGTSEVVEIKTQQGSIAGGDYCASVRYTANATGSEVLIEVINLKADLSITLGFTSTAQNLKESSTGVSTVAVTSTMGGYAYVIGDDFENLADTDTITCVAKVCMKDYEFVGWYKSSDMDTVISTNASVRFNKADIYGEELIAVFSKVSNTNINDQTSN